MDYCAWQLPDFRDQARRYGGGAAEARLQAWLEAAAWQHSPHIEATAPGMVTLYQARPFQPEVLPPDAQLDLRRAWAHTPDLAWLAIALTRFEEPEQQLDRPEALDALPVTALGLSDKTRSILHTWGIHRCNAFRRLGRSAIADKLGQEAAQAWDRLSGRWERPLVRLKPPQFFSAEQEWEYALETLEPLLFLLKRLLHELSLQLAAACKVAAAIDLHLRLDNRQPDSRHCFRLPEPTRRPDILLRTLQVRLEQLRLAHPIIGLRLELEPTPEQQQQADIFVTALHDPHRFSETLARLSALVGADSVGSPVLCDSHRPDAVELQTLRSRLATSQGMAEVDKCPGHGLWLHRFRPPLPAKVSWLDERPCFVSSPLFTGPVVNSHGPWLLCGEWWEQGRYWHLVEWDLHLKQGPLLRLAQRNNRWQLVGHYH